MNNVFLWKDLFNTVRIRELENQAIEENEDTEIRNAFDRDYDRIIYSSSVRRLQDKTQVFPLQRNDFTRTRLTHSMEVASLGESMAWSIASKLNEMGIDEFQTIKDMKRLPSMVKVACLVHDLGNPPFGHYGEEIIKKWFSNFFKDNKDILTQKEKNDFLNFDGNAQTIHILCSLQFLNDSFGVNFTTGTLAALMKYPWSSSDENVGKGKFGFMQSEIKIYEYIMQNIGVGKDERRHPAALIMEAADDIAYRVVDLEDGIKKELVPWSEHEEKMNINLSKVLDKSDYKKYLQKIEGKSVLVRYQNFKIKLQGVLIKKSIENFINNYNEIMCGKYKDDLYHDDHLSDILNDIKKYTEKYCFNNPEVLTLELMGDKVMSDLLDMFIPAILSMETKKDKKLVSLISENFKKIQVLDFTYDKSPTKQSSNLDDEVEKLNNYRKIQIVVDYISGMTDSFASELHKKLKNGNI